MRRAAERPTIIAADTPIPSFGLTPAAITAATHAAATYGDDVIFDEDGKIVGRHRWRDRDRWLTTGGGIILSILISAAIIAALVWWLTA